MLDCTSVQRLISCFRREQAEKFYRVSEGTADHTRSQAAFKASVDNLIRECKKKGTTYTDDEFPITANESEDVLRKIKHWRRIENINAKDSKGITNWSMFDDPQPSDVVQGELGNCWFMSAVSIISDKPHILDRIFVTKKYNRQGVYGLQLYVDGEWKCIIVDDRFPCDQNGELLFASAAKKQLWVPLLEKALAKLFGSYSALTGGCMSVGFALLTGAPVEALLSDSQLSTKEGKTTTFARLHYALKDKLLLLCNTAEADDAGTLAAVGLENNHTYSILDATIVDQNHRLLLLRNIWGSRPFTGKWSPRSYNWKMVIDKQTLPESCGDASQGTFWISIDDFSKYFRSMLICYARENYYECHMKAELPRSESDEWETFEIEVTEETCIDISFKPITGISSEYTDLILATVFIFDDNNNLIGSTNCRLIEVALWKGKLLTPGIYRVCLFAFTKWNATSSIPYNFVVHSSRKVNCWKISKPIVQLRNILEKLMLKLGEQTQVGEITLYTFPENLWLGTILAASNNSQTDEIGCIVKRICYDNAVSTRTLGNTHDTLLPGHSQLMQILSSDGSDGIFLSEFEFSVENLSGARSTKPDHYPPITRNAAKLHGTFLTDII